jgi:catechol 2,3-dioxygenase-like lactoylglutathione lyase family enzyme
MLSYVYFGTNDLERAIAFYTATLAPLGMERCSTGDPAIRTETKSLLFVVVSENDKDPRHVGS